jgi:hypothetical protein
VISAFDRYISDIKGNLRLDDDDESEVITELTGHIEDEYLEMRNAGLSEEEAVTSCIRFFGSAAMIARQIYEAHSQGTWRESMLATLPHILFALLFTVNWLRGTFWMMVVLGAVVAMALYAWNRGKPVWLFPWRGYYFLPVLITGVLLFYLPRGWSWLAIVMYLPLVSTLVWSVTVKTVKRDWLYSGLMMLPVPIVIAWFFTVGDEGNVLNINLNNVEYYKTGIALTFLALAGTTIAFLRMRKRWMRGVLLILSGFLTLVTITFYSEGRIGLPLFLGLTLIMLILLLSPAIVDRKIRQKILNLPEKNRPAR